MVSLLKHGRPCVYQRCECCGHFAPKLSDRRWCNACEWEFSTVGKRARAKLEEMRERGEQATLRMVERG